MVARSCLVQCSAALHRRPRGYSGRAASFDVRLISTIDEEALRLRAYGKLEKQNRPELAGLLTTEPASVRAPSIYVTTTVMADGPQAKKSKQGPPVAAMARVESCVLGPASAGRRDPPGPTPPTVSPPEIVRDVNVVSDPPSPAAEPALELAIISDLELTSVRNFPVSGTSSRLTCT